MSTINLIQIKRSVATDTPSGLANGELAFSFTDSSNSLFIGDPRNGTPGTPLRIGGGRYSFLQNVTLQGGEGGILSANAVMITNANNFIDKLRTNNLIVGPDGTTTPAITSITADDTLTTVANSQLATSWAIKTYIDTRVQSAINTSSAANGQILVYNTADAAFKNKTMFGDATIDVDGNIQIVNNTIVNTDISDSAQIDYLKLDLVGDIVNTDISDTANIQRIKMAPGQPRYVLINDESGDFTEEAQLAPLRGGTGVDSSAAPNGAILIGNNTGFTLTTLTATTDEIEITNTQGGIQIGLPDNVVITANLAANNLYVTHDLTISGNLSVEGTLTTIDTVNLVIEDPLLMLAKNQSAANNSGDLVDIGFYGAYANATHTKYTGLFRDASDDGVWKLFEGLQDDPTTTVDKDGTGYRQATLKAALISNNVVITGGTITNITDLVVADGGTGRSTFTSAGILYGNAAGPIGVTSAGANGDVLQVVAGLPQFGTLDGGTF